MPAEDGGSGGTTDAGQRADLGARPDPGARLDQGRPDDGGGAAQEDLGGGGDDLGTAEPVHLRINFGPPGFAPPAGWLHDGGELFHASRGYGWTRDLREQTRLRDVAGDPLLDSAIFPGLPGAMDTWEIVVPNGRYRVSVVSGDQYEQGPNRIEIEGVVCREATPEVCDGADNDCDGQIDEGDVCAPDRVCYSSTMGSQAQVEADGFTDRGGVFRDGGFAVDASGHRVERTLGGAFHTGFVEFEARDLLRVIPHDEASHGCERFIYNLNLGGRDDPDRTRRVFANMASDCAGSPRGNLRVILFGDGGFCCMDTGRLPEQSDGAWHRFRVEWDGGEVRLLVDGAVWARSGYRDVTVGVDPRLLFGSESVPGDQTGAVFRNLRICNSLD